MKTLEQNLMELIYALNKFQKKNVFSEACKKLNPAELKIFEVINPETKITMTDISKNIGTSKGATSLLINKLVNKKLLSRSYDNNDRRIVYISLTKDGKLMHQSYLNCKHKVLGSICKSLKELDKDLVSSIIKKLTTEFNKEC